MSLKKIRILPDQYVFKQNEKGDTAFLVISGGLIAELDSKKIGKIEPGEILEFKKDKTIIAKVLEDDKIEFRGRSMSLSPAALIVIKELGYEWSKIAGPQFWCYKGKTLYEISSLK